MFRRIMQCILILTLCQSAWAGSFLRAESAVRYCEHTSKQTDFHAAEHAMHQMHGSVADTSSATGHDCCQKDVSLCHHQQCHNIVSPGLAMLPELINLGWVPSEHQFQKLRSHPLPPHITPPDRPPTLLL